MVLRPHSRQEIIHIQIGKSGNEIAHEFWRDLVEEHEIQYEKEDTRGQYQPSDEYEDLLGVFFNEGQKKRWVPRAILMDLNMSDLAMITQDPLGDLYRPENIIGNDEGSGNCYAKAYHTEGPDLADKCLETVRKEVEKCNCLQGIQFTHGISGGTGSGLTGLVMRTMKEYLGGSSKVIMQNICVFPSPGVSDVLIEPYNATLACADLVEDSHQVFVFDNQALTSICQKTLNQDVPKMKTLNNVVALCMAGISSPLRYTGFLNADLRKLHVNLVPFGGADQARLKFLITSFAPLTQKTTEKYRQMSALDLAQQMLSKENVTCSVDPLCPGIPEEHIPMSRFLASWATWRGKWENREIDHLTHDIWKPGSRYDKFFPDWIPNPIANNICAKGHCQLGNSVVFISNSTSVSAIFRRVHAKWTSMFNKKAYVHVFEQEGISQEDMVESAQNVADLIQEYDHYSTLSDKLGEDADTEQTEIFRELLELRQGVRKGEQLDYDPQTDIAREVMHITNK